MSTLKHNTLVLISTPGGTIFTISSTTLLLPPESPSNSGAEHQMKKFFPIREISLSITGANQYKKMSNG